jgi:hypothetical protein
MLPMRQSGALPLICLLSVYNSYRMTPPLGGLLYIFSKYTCGQANNSREALKRGKCGSCAARRPNVMG